MTCAHCGALLNREPGVGLVDTLSGDDGGTYDHCPDSPNGKHAACVAHATCGHRVRWTGAIRDGELILGTGCWVHILDASGRTMPDEVTV
jgi:hypothetical protein